MKTVYLLGPMTGLPMENRPAFQRATAALRKLGFDVISPDELDHHDPSTDTEWSAYLSRDIPHLISADAGVCLHGWRRSKGASLESTILTQLGRPLSEIHYTDDGEAYLLPVSPDQYPRITHP